MDKGKGKMDDKGKGKEERKKNTRNAPLRIGGEEGRKEEEEEEEDEKEVEDKAFDLSSLNYGLLGAIAAKKDREAAANTKKRKFMASFFCGQTQKSMKTSDAKSSDDAGVSSSKSGNPFSCFGGASSKPKCSTDNQASPAIPPSSRPEQSSSVPRGLFTYVRGRFRVTKVPDHVAAGLSNVPLDQRMGPPPPRPVSPPLHPPPPPPFNPLLRSSSNPETSSAPRGFFTFVKGRFRVTRPIGAAAGADTDANPRPNTSATDLQSSTAAAAASDDNPRPVTSFTDLQSSTSADAAASDDNRRPVTSSTDLQSSTAAAAGSDDNRRPVSSSTDLQSSTAAAAAEGSDGNSSSGSNEEVDHAPEEPQA